MRLLLGACLLAVSCLGSVAAFITMRQVSAMMGAGSTINGPVIQANGGQPAANALGTPLPAAPQSTGAQAVVAPSLHPWDGASRVTVLLIGLDARDWETNQGAPRSDTMILLTLDPLNKTAGILSIPRDMWVPIPGFSHGKINTAYALGEANKLPGGGPALAIKTVETFLGVPVNYYAQIDFDAFVKFIDEIGGVKVDVPAKIKIDLLGDGANTIKYLQPGPQVLPGAWALAYARMRYTEDGDFDRARRQQQVILGIRDRMLKVNMLPTMIAKAPTLYQELASGIHTNLTLDQVIKLALLAKDVPQESIQSGVLGKDTVLFGESPDKLSILIPIPDKIHLVRDKIFAASSSLGPQAPGDAQAQMKAEGARLVVLNGSAQDGLSTRTAEYLRAQGANIAQVGNADQASGITYIVDYTGNPYMLKYLSELLKLPEGRILSRYDPNSSVDVELVLGNDWAAKNSLP